MKKIISLVLALVLVCAAPGAASALTGDIIEPGPTSGGVFTNINLRLVENLPGMGFSLIDIAAGRAYYQNQTIYFALEYTAPDRDDIPMHPLDYDEPAVVISSPNVDFWLNSFSLYVSQAGAITTLPITPQPAVTYASKATVPVPMPQDNDPDIALHYLLVGSGIVRGTTSGYIRAEFQGIYTSTKFFGPVSGGNIDALIEAANGEFGTGGGVEWPIFIGQKTIYSVRMLGLDDPRYVVTAYDSNEDLIGGVVFYTERDQTVADSTKNVTKIEIALNPGQGDPLAYLVNDTGTDISGGGTSSLQFYRADGADILEVLFPFSTGGDLTTYNALKSLYQGVMGFFGLQFSRQGILLPIHFAQKFSIFYDKTEVRVPLSTDVATVDDPGVEIPPTGDAAPIAGFAMLALAVIAGLGLAYRKVRS